MKPASPQHRPFRPDRGAGWSKRWRASLLLVLMTLGPAGGVAGVAVEKGETGEAASGLKTLMLERGPVLLRDPVTTESFASTWRVHAGEWTIDGDAVRSAEKAGQTHHPQAGHQMKLRGAVVQYRFRLDGAKWMGFSFTAKEHVLRVMVGPNHFEILRMSGIGKTTKGERLDRMPMTWEPGRWYTLLIEYAGTEVLAQIDNQWVLYGSAPSLDTDISQVLLLNSGSKAWFDDLTIWQPQPKKEWEQVRELVLQQKAKRGPK